jgi:hypothetical protein
LQPFELRSDSERLIDKADLLDNIASCPATGSALCESCSSPRSPESFAMPIHTAKAQTRRDTLFDESMILFEHVV